MSVYTSVSAPEIQAWLNRYAVGELLGLEPIAAGIENTNYFVNTTGGSYVLTLYERLPSEELPFYLNLMAHLAKHGVPCPAPIADRTGAYFSLLNGKPAGLVLRLDGSPIMQPKAKHCAEVARALASLHIASTTFSGRQANRRGSAWWRQAARAVHASLTTSQAQLLVEELEHHREEIKEKLPRGAIHGDLFRDNVLFRRQRVSGIIDFGFAATDALAYDLAITVNDWCSEQDGSLNRELTKSLLAAYHEVRPLTSDEQTVWPMLLRAAALRFWLSRLYDFYLPRSGELTHAKDPLAFEIILRARVANDCAFEL